MNKYKLLSLVSFLLLSASCFSQSKTVQEKQRVVVWVEDRAIVAELDSTGAIDQKIIDIPNYFDEDYGDAHYIALSYDRKPEKENVAIEKQDKQVSSRDTAHIKSFKPEQ